MSEPTTTPPVVSEEIEKAIDRYADELCKAGDDFKFTPEKNIAAARASLLEKIAAYGREQYRLGRMDDTYLRIGHD